MPGIAGMSVMSTTFSALAMNITFLREHGRPQAHPRHAAADRLLPRRASPANAVTNAAIQVAIVVLAGKLFFGIGWPKDWLELVVFVVARRRLLRRRSASRSRT